MANLLKISLLLLAVAIVACSAEAPKSKLRQVRRFQQQKQKQPLRLAPKRKFARQEEPVTPYPTAEELKPEVAFEEGNVPDEVYGPPDEVYGPPEADVSSPDVLPSEDAPVEFAPNPDAEEFQPSELEAERLTSRKKANKKIVPSRLTQKKKKSQKSQRLVAAAPAPVVAAAAPAVPVSAVPFTAAFPASAHQYFVVNQPFSYSAQYQIW
ncbi:uncharacterized protein LOC101888691 [Musca domestica]|uniref:Uncharacterized protein LOC101888691 n=1 Tax=Musca domestica TaxID=7370 RepID=A0A1I8N1E0_MUSDO|nr:uncharacterized protein LOC101888691 [Musca domestica]